MNHWTVNLAITNNCSLLGCFNCNIQTFTHSQAQNLWKSYWTHKLFTRMVIFKVAVLSVFQVRFSCSIYSLISIIFLFRNIHHIYFLLQFSQSTLFCQSSDRNTNSVDISTYTITTRTTSKSLSSGVSIKCKISASRNRTIWKLKTIVVNEPRLKHQNWVSN